jgi:hypothetical protein
VGEIPWFKVDDGFWAHPKVLELSTDAGWLWTRAGAYSAQQLTDGRITVATLAMLGSAVDTASELVSAGLWDVTRNGWEFHDWEKYQPTREEVLEERRKSAERVRKFRESRKNPRAGNAVTNGVTNAVGSPSPTRPDPTNKGIGKRKPETPIPDSWNPTPNHVAFAVEFGIDLGHEVSQFRAHATANDRRQRDWDAAFRQWLGNAKQWAKPDRPGPSMPVAPRAAEVRECAVHAGYPLPCPRCAEGGAPY